MGAEATSPTRSSRKSLSVTSPSTAPYSSTTRAIRVCDALNISSSRNAGTAAGYEKEDLESLKKQLAGIEKDDKTSKEKLGRLLNLYLEGNIPQASYIVKSSELEAEAERLSQMKADLQRRIQNHERHDATTD